MFGSIDKEIDENLAELQENKQDIYDGQAELEMRRRILPIPKQSLPKSSRS